MELLDLFRNSECVNWIVKDIRKSKTYITRHEFLIQTVSCRVWQLITMVMETQCTPSIIKHFTYYCHSQKKTKPVEKVLAEIIQIIDIIMSGKTHVSRIILENIPLPFDGTMGIQPIQSIEQLECQPAKYYPMCIYYIDKISHGGILHYFTIVFDGTTYFLLSSYGSDYVHVPQYITPLNPASFNEFCVLIQVPLAERETHTRYNDIVPTFVTTYFLSNGVRKRHDENIVEVTPKLKPKWIEPTKGMMAELDVFLKNQNTLLVGYIRGYDTEIQRVVKELGFTGKKRRCSRRRYRKRRGSKNITP